jgi:hypothetical protein
LLGLTTRRKAEPPMTSMINAEVPVMPTVPGRLSMTTVWPPSALDSAGS